MKEINSIIVIYNKYSGNYSQDKINIILTFLKSIHSNVILKCSEYSGHINEICSLLPPNIIIVSCGGDGTLHQIFNGLNNNINYEKIYIATIPLGSGNHLAKQNECNNINDSLDKIVAFLKLGNLNEINPTEVHTKEKVILSINSIVGGLPCYVTFIANSISRYIPKFLHRKYDLAALLYFFIHKSSKSKSKFKINNISNINSIFFQTTNTCGNMVIDENIKLKSSLVNASFTKENNLLKLIYIWIKVKNGFFKDSRILRNKSENYIVDGKGFIIIDGENIKINTPCKITRSKKKFYLI